MGPLYRAQQGHSLGWVSALRYCHGHERRWSWEPLRASRDDEMAALRCFGHGRRCGCEPLRAVSDDEMALLGDEMAALEDGETVIAEDDEQERKRRKMSMRLNKRIQELGKAKKWRDIQPAMREAENAGFELDTYAYSAAIGAMSLCGETEKCYELLNEMKGKGMEPGIFAWNGVVAAASKA
ncbi:unnamed protein product, partial [Chrysoparadoxa australica]